jgi:hypothetical protein
VRSDKVTKKALWQICIVLTLAVHLLGFPGLRPVGFLRYEEHGGYAAQRFGSHGADRAAVGPGTAERRARSRDIQVSDIDTALDPLYTRMFKYGIFDRPFEQTPIDDAAGGEKAHAIGARVPCCCRTTAPCRSTQALRKSS